MTELRCPICNEIEHDNKKWEIEQFISQTQEEITSQLIAKNFSISEAQACKYLNKLTEIDVLDKSKRGRTYIYKFKK